VVDALDDGLAVAADGDGALGAVGEHLTGHLHAGSRHLPHLLDLGPALAYKRAALRGWDDEAQGDGRLGDAGAGHQALQVLLELGADQGERLEDAGVGPRHRDDPLGTGAVCDVDLGSALLSKSFHNVSFLSNDASNLLALHEQPNGEGGMVRVGGHRGLYKVASSSHALWTEGRRGGLGWAGLR